MEQDDAPALRIARAVRTAFPEYFAGPKALCVFPADHLSAVTRLFSQPPSIAAASRSDEVPRNAFQFLIAEAYEEREAQGMLDLLRPGGLFAVSLTAWPDEDFSDEQTVQVFNSTTGGGVLAGFTKGGVNSDLGPLRSYLERALRRPTDRFAAFRSVFRPYRALRGLKLAS